MSDYPHVWRPFCEGADPESKGIVENLVGYVKSDLMVPEELSVSDLVGANAKGRAWCQEVNARVHSEIAAIPAERLLIERPLLGDLPSLRARIGKVAMRKVDRLSCVRFGSARYSVPTAHIGRTVELRVDSGTVVIVVLGEIIAEHGLIPYILSAIPMVESGLATAEDIDTGMTEGCAHPIGPLALGDLIGLDTTQAVPVSMNAEFKEPLYAPPPLLSRMVEAGLMGRKSGRRFYSYISGR